MLGNDKKKSKSKSNSLKKHKISKLKSVSDKLDKQSSEFSDTSSDFKSVYSERGHLIKNKEESYVKLLSQIINFKEGVYTPHILNKSELEHILKNPILNFYSKNINSYLITLDQYMYLYLSIKYPKLCYPKESKNNIDLIDKNEDVDFIENYISSDNYYNNSLKWFNEGKKGFLGYKSDKLVSYVTTNKSIFTKMFRKCLNEPVLDEFIGSRYIIIHLVIIIPNSEVFHSNIIIYDKINKTFERYEPYGRIIQSSYNFEELDRQLMLLFSAIINEKITIRNGRFLKNDDYGLQYLEQKPLSILTKSGKQKPIDRAGYCFFWCILYVDFKLNNPNINHEETRLLFYKLARKSLDKKNNFKPLSILDKSGASLVTTLSNPSVHPKSRYKTEKIEYNFNSYIRNYALFIYILNSYATDIISEYAILDNIETMNESYKLCKYKINTGINRILQFLNSETGSLKYIKKKSKKSKKSKKKKKKNK
jgi:hypothetical protein